MNHRANPLFISDEPRPNRFAPSTPRLKLLPPLRGNHIVMSAEIKRPLARSSPREDTVSLAPHIIETESAQFLQQRPYALLVPVPRRILRWNRDQPLREIQHRGLGKPFSQSSGNLPGIATHFPIIPKL